MLPPFSYSHRVHFFSRRSSDSSVVHASRLLDVIEKNAFMPKNDNSLFYALFKKISMNLLTKTTILRQMMRLKVGWVAGFFFLCHDSFYINNLITKFQDHLL